MGRELTLKLANLFSNATLVLWDINRDGLDETATICRKLGAKKVSTFVVDLSICGEITRNADLVRQKVGDVTMLINNAGISPYKMFLDCDPKTEEKVMRVNLLSQMWTIRQFLPKMIENGGGHLVSVCAAIALCRFRYLSAYAASKYGLRGFLETLRLELELCSENPTVNLTVVYPGWVKTDMTREINWNPRYNCQPFVTLDVDVVAERILEGILKEEEEIYFPGALKYMQLLQW